ncbi:hypothetical protein Cgig2_014563 [Carnegiea gigantea]|uniref:Pentatricopeptide repeat-containing protein n=1 Tax=Carnegiea gigantea TaxID=171969 RepID=A0A9Q1L189_9CARY|nr:hypothetical protein Cgig2_014563 [Carnegiea gigantea]
MAVATLYPRSRVASAFLSRLFSLSLSHPTPPPPPPPIAPPEDVNDISRVLSDFRSPHHDIEDALAPFSSKLSTNLVEQVLKRTKNLGFAAHRFFLWAKRFPVRAFNRMVDFGLRPSSNDLDHLLYLLCKRKLVKHGQEFFDKVKQQFGPSVKTYSILIRGWGDIDDSVHARKMFDEMLQRGCVVDVPAYNSLLEALCNGGDIDEAYAMFRDMASKGLTPDANTYSIFIRSYCKRDNIHSVFRVLDRMKRYNLVPNLYTYNCIIKRLCANQKVEEAYQLLDEMIKAGVNPDTWTYNTIQAFHCDHCEVNRALRLLSRMEKENCKPDRHTYNMLLKMLIKIGRFDKVEEVWDSMPRRGFYPSVSTYAVMIHGFLKKKRKLEEACKYFETMIDEGVPPYSSTIELLRNRLLGLGFSDQIDILADKMEASSCSSIKELSKAMRGHRSQRRRRGEESSELSEEEWPFRPDSVDS